MPPRLQIGIYASPTGALVADYSHLAEDVEWGNDEHGFADLSLFVPLQPAEAFYLFDRSGLPWAKVVDNGYVVWEGRLEDPTITPRGLQLGFLGAYRGLSDFPHTASYTSVTANTIVIDLLTSAPYLSTSSALIQSPGVTISEAYDDKTPAEILDRLCRLGDNQTPPRIWKACVWENRMLTFAPRTDGARDWYVDVSDFDIERTLQTLYNSAYGIYYDTANARAVSATSTDQPSVNRWGVTRRKAANAQTRSSTVAGKVRDTVIEDGREPAPRSKVTFDKIYDAAGAEWPKWFVRFGDSITIRNLPPTLTLNRIRTFRVLQARYRPETDTLSVTPESPLATIEEQLSGGPSHSASSRSTPLGKLDDRIGGLEQEVHGGPGGGGGGGAGGGGSYLVPPGGIMLFESACPVGWSEVTALRGRVPVGVPSGGTALGTVGTALTNLGTRTISTVVAHVHAVGTLVAAGEAAHTHGDGSLANSSESAHIHSVDPPQTSSLTESVGHTHSATTGSGGTHNHDVTAYTTGGGATVVAATNASAVFGDITDAAVDAGSHTHSVTTGGASATHTHGVNIAPFDSDAGSSHTHTITGTTAAGSSHTHTLSGSTASTGSATVDVTMPYIQYFFCKKD